MLRFELYVNLQEENLIRIRSKDLVLTKLQNC